MFRSCVFNMDSLPLSHPHHSHSCGPLGPLDHLTALMCGHEVLGLAIRMDRIEEESVPTSRPESNMTLSGERSHLDQERIITSRSRSGSGSRGPPWRRSIVWGSHTLAQVDSVGSNMSLRPGWAHCVACGNDVCRQRHSMIRRELAVAK